MFTRIPTFIPTESNVLETVKEQQSPKKEGKKATYGIAQEASRRRKRAKAIRKRIAAKKAEDGHYEELPVIISGRDSRAHAIQTPTSSSKLRNSKLFETRTTGLSTPYTPPVHKVYNGLYGGRKTSTGRFAYSDARHSRETTFGDIASVDTADLSEETDMLTHPTMHKRHRRKLTDETQDAKVSKHAKNWLHSNAHYHHEERNMLDDTSRTMERDINRNGSISPDSQSLNTPVPTELQLNARGSKPQHHEIDGSKNFKSKIPIRFPDIQENKRYTEKSKNCPPTKLSTTLPPIVRNGTSRGSPDRDSGRVTQSILDYQNIVEQDFKRLGENLENTFKLLHQYIKCSSNTNTTM